MILVPQDLRLAVRQASNTSTTATVQVCRYSVAVSECKWSSGLTLVSQRPPSPAVNPTVSLPTQTVLVSVVLHDAEHFSGAAIMWQANWTVGTPRCWGVRNLSLAVCWDCHLQPVYMYHV
jgi:hypothetical protein